MIILKENGTAFFFEMEYCGFDIANAFIYRDINVAKEVRNVLFNTIRQMNQRRFRFVKMTVTSKL